MLASLHSRQLPVLSAESDNGLQRRPQRLTYTLNGSVNVTPRAWRYFSTVGDRFDRRARIFSALLSAPVLIEPPA